jgi:hypothetical protein
MDITREIFIMNQPTPNNKINAVCVNWNKRFTSIRGVSMHLRMTGTRHIVNFINYGNYDKKTGLTEIDRHELYFHMSHK